MTMIEINGEIQEVNPEIPLDKPLLWFLRENQLLTGTKYGCGVGFCGACTIHVDGKALQSCVVTVGEVIGKSVTTIEGFNDELGSQLKTAWIDNNVPQCGYCQPGFIMSAGAMLAGGGMVCEGDIADLPNVCRCGTYNRIEDAIKSVARSNRCLKEVNS